ncbi:MAG: histidine phosphatase family protein [Chloroflexia bacterium]|nr:histidine phosphatase family protein [Chloroflexia bacterium]
MSLRVVIVQHAEKEPAPGDPGLTMLVHRQARTCGVALVRHAPFNELWSSPQRRALETAASCLPGAGSLLM